MAENKIIKTARAIKEAQQRKAAAIANEKKQKAREVRERLANEFREVFADYLDAIADLGITWHIELDDDRYFHQGGIVIFQKDDRTAKMNFDSATSYRYEYIPYQMSLKGNYGRMAFGAWPPEGIAEFLADQFALNL